MRRALGISLAVVAAALALPASAGAHALVRPGGELVSYLAVDATSLNTLTVRADGGQIEFRDPTVDGGMDPGSCTPGELSAESWIIQTFCPLSGVRRVRIDLGDREDSTTVSLPIPATVLGGLGADRVETGGTADELSGGEGNDRLTAGAGDDLLDGGLGADEFDAGAGADRIVARDGVADVVRCGDDEDTVDADTLDDVAADCENATRSAADAPPGGADEPGRPQVAVGAPTLQAVARSRTVRVYATSSEPASVSASGFLDAGGLELPIQRVGRRQVRVGGGGVALSYLIGGRHWQAARAALRRGRRVFVRLAVVATDQAGNSSRRNAPRIRLVAGGGARPLLSGTAVRPLLAGAAARPLLPGADHPEPGDVDGDEIRDEVDNCPTVKNGSQINSDGDPEGDACDSDDDNDGVPDAQPDNCRIIANPLQEDSDNDGYGDACPPIESEPDGSEDGIIDDDDNCDTVPNPDQADLDGDDRGDACDIDDDGDGFRDQSDNCPTVYNVEPVDVDGNGFLDDQLDRDGDGIGTACDADESVVEPPEPGGPGSRSDRTAPRLRLGIARTQRLAAVAAGLIARLRCSEACTATTRLRLAGRRRVLSRASSQLDGAGSTYAFVKLGRPLRRLLVRRRAASVTLTVSAVDGRGNRSTRSRAVRIRA